MRILDSENKSRLYDIVLYLKKHEIVYLIGALENLLDNSSSGDHCHVNDDEYKNEITVTLYDENKLDMFDERSKKLILDKD
jgi:hypothetical protein